MNIGKLQHLVTVLENTTGNFQLDTWGSNIIENGRIELNCNTVCCAIGWACFDEEFQAQGLKYGVIGSSIIPVYNDMDSWDAVCDFFEIEHFDALRLFSANEYPIDKRTKEDVIYRINAFIVSSEEIAA